MYKVRFRANSADPRPVNWPVKHPYWITDIEGPSATVVSYADNSQYVFDNWPEAVDLQYKEAQEYEFSDRYPRPAWLRATFGEMELDRNIIQKEVQHIFNSVQDANLLTQKVGKLLLALNNVDIVDEYKVSVNFINKKLHINYSWADKNRRGMTFNLEGKTITENAMRVFSKEGDDQPDDNRSKRG